MWLTIHIWLSEGYTNLLRLYYKFRQGICNHTWEDDGTYRDNWGELIHTKTCQRCHKSVILKTVVFGIDHC